jgi:hypothetical protein
MVSLFSHLCRWMDSKSSHLVSRYRIAINRAMLLFLGHPCQLLQSVLKILNWLGSLLGFSHVLGLYLFDLIKFTISLLRIQSYFPTFSPRTSIVLRRSRVIDSKRMGFWGWGAFNRYKLWRIFSENDWFGVISLTFAVLRHRFSHFI